MTRLIPGKTKVEVELFRGVTLGDVLVVGIALAMLIFVFLSNLPYKLVIAIVVAGVAGLLLFRIDGQANYHYLLHILGHFGYDRHFAKVYTDKMLLERGEGRGEEAAFDELFRQRMEQAETKAEKKQRLKAEKRAEQARAAERKREDKILKSKTAPEEEKEAIRQKRAAEAAEEDKELAESVQDTEAEVKTKQSAKERKAQEKAREKQRKEEDKILKSKSVPEEEKEIIRVRRRRESEEAMRAMADAKDAAISRKSMAGIVGFTAVKNGLIEYNGGEYYGAVIEIDPVEFRFFSEHRRKNSIEAGVGRILRAINPKYSANIVKLERPIRYESYLDKEYDKLYQLRTSYESGLLTEDELKASARKGRSSPVSITLSSLRATSASWSCKSATRAPISSRAR